MPFHDLANIVTYSCDQFWSREVVFISLEPGLVPEGRGRQAEFCWTGRALEGGSRQKHEGHVMSRITTIFGGAVAVAVLVSAQAGPVLAHDETAQSQVVRVTATQGFSWFSNGRTAAEAERARRNLTGIQSARLLGHGSWICSPAGFGKKSKCFAR